MNAALRSTIRIFTHGSLVMLISGGIILGIAVALLSPQTAISAGILGSLFVGALKAVAPILVFILVITAVCSHSSGNDTNIRAIIVLYFIGTFLAALTAVAASFLFPATLTLVVNDASVSPPNGISDVLHTLLMKVVDNPVRALMTGNYIGILAWAVGLGLALRRARGSTKEALSDISQAVSVIVRFIIRLAPFGIFGLVASTVANTGIKALLDYAQLLAVLLGSMLFIALVINPAIVFWKLRSNPYPLVLTCLRESGITAFFTRSSAANIPVNMALAEKLKLNKDTYSVSIPLGAAINMAGAAITITVLTLAAVNTLGIKADFASALLLSLVAAVSACGASGIAGGSLLLIPLACALFGIADDVAMQVVAVGFIIGVVQDSAETALNSSTDVLFTAAACGPNQCSQQPEKEALQPVSGSLNEPR